MNAKLDNLSPAAVTGDVFVSGTIHAKRWLISAAALAMTVLTLTVVTHPTIHAPRVAWINGIHVTDMAPVQVTPSAAEMKAATVLEHAAVGAASGAAAQLGAQLAMPYYSFGTASASSKE